MKANLIKRVSNLPKQVLTFYFEVKQGERQFNVALRTDLKGIFGDWKVTALNGKKVTPNTEDAIINYLDDNWDELIGAWGVFTVPVHWYLMNKKNDAEKQKQIKKINDRLEILAARWNKQFDQNIQELYALSTLLRNVEDGYLEVNKALL